MRDLKKFMGKSAFLTLMTFSSTISDSYSKKLEKENNALESGVLKGVSLISAASSIFILGKIIWEGVFGGKEEDS